MLRFHIILFYICMSDQPGVSHWMVACAAGTELQESTDHGYVSGIQNLRPVPEDLCPELWGGC